MSCVHADGSGMVVMRLPKCERYHNRCDDEPEGDERQHPHAEQADRDASGGRTDREASLREDHTTQI
jgi:hypothetical protein